MPLGNLTSQFFANVYLNELDQFVKHTLKVRYYIRYVYDFVVLHESYDVLRSFKVSIECFLRERLALTLHPDKSKIIILKKGINFLGFRLFYHHRLLRRKNVRKFERKMEHKKNAYHQNVISREDAIESLEGWLAYAMHADTYKYRRSIVQKFNIAFPIDKSEPIKNIAKHRNFTCKSQSTAVRFSYQKTSQLFRKGIPINEIAQRRNLKAGTIWQHIAHLISQKQISLWKVLHKEMIAKILSNVKNVSETLSAIKSRIHDPAITYDEIACVMAHLKSLKDEQNICDLFAWYKKSYCYRKCFFNKKQRQVCAKNMELICHKASHLEMARKSFLQFFNDNLSICILSRKEKIRFVTWREFREALAKAKKS
jgi:hypothetical protein